MARTWCVVLFLSLASFGFAGEASAGRVLLSSPESPAPSASATSNANATQSPAPYTLYGDPENAPKTDPSELPPAGITPTTATLAQVLRLYRMSRGMPTSRVTTVRESETLNAYGESGAYNEVDSGDDYFTKTQIGPTTFERGKYKNQSWQQDENGFTNLVSGVHQEEEVSSETLAAAVRGQELSSVKLLGVVASPVNAYVVEVNPPGGRHEWIFIDTKSGRLVRREASRLGRRLVYTYDDFRTTNGITMAWHDHYADGRPGNDIDRRTTEIDYNQPVSTSELAIPASRSPLHFPAGVTDVKLPARIEGGVIIVRLTINGRGLDFQLDSGAAGIVLDADVAKQLGLSTFGKLTAATAGTYQASQAIVPQIQIGDLTMDNVDIDCLPFNFNADSKTRVVGLLGYDFFAGSVVKVDYLAKTIDAIAPDAFVSPKGEAFQMPIKLDDRQPMVTARLGDGSDGTFIVDTGAFGVLVFPPYVKAHREDLSYVDYGFGFGSIFTPLIFSSGVGGDIGLRPMVASAFHFAGVGFNDFEVFEAVAKSDFEGEDNDGLIGYEFLRYFDIYFDYKDSMIVFQPNALLASHKTTGP